MPDIPATRASLLLRLRDPRDEEAWAQFLELYTPLVYGLVAVWPHGYQAGPGVRPP